MSKADLERVALVVAEARRLACQMRRDLDALDAALDAAETYYTTDREGRDA